MSDPLRPAVHLTPAAGWLNDPNGLVFWGDRLHVFYQLEPDAPRWGTMRWGHASSGDLLTWRHHPVALAPTPGAADELGCWSGCVVRDDAGLPLAFYTGVRGEPATERPEGFLRRASICRATGDAALDAWEKDPEPVIAGAPEGILPDMFRDPYVWRDDRGWSMAVGAGTDAGRGAVLLYRSPDLARWSYVGPFLTTEALIAACPGLDVAEIDSACWECPQVARLGDQALLIISIVDRSPVVRPAHVVAITGTIEGDRFRPVRAERLGMGPDVYAPAIVPLADRRALLMGWIPEDPPDAGDGRDWAGAMTLPRAVSLDPSGRPRIHLLEELGDLGTPVEGWHGIEVTDSVPWTMELGALHAEVRLVIEPRGVPIRLDLRAGGVLVADIRFDPRNGRLAATRNGRVGVAGRSPRGVATLPASAAERLDLRLVMDGTVMELVAADVVTATIRLPPVRGPRSLVLTAFGGACLVAHAELRSLVTPVRPPEPGPGPAPGPAPEPARTPESARPDR